jgi:uncharacterized alkaline shock family protein YloU
MNPLQSERGTTRIDDQVVAKVAGIAAQEVEGVRMGGGATSRAIGGMMEKVTGPSVTQGVSVEVGQVEAAVDLTMAALYGKSIPQLVEAVRNNVIRRIETLVGLRVTEVNIVIGDVYFEGEGVWSGAQAEPVEETARVVR